ncbi:UDP-N-acetylglucosamine 2-epimerase [Schleiferiaceae bacterium]|nr:UDP-N-acetylglucosamine 2-epimerase [Schleiferiaceae bacterium]
MKKVCVFTGGRAEYGLLVPLIELLNEAKDIDLQLLVTGMHLSPEFGLTYRNILSDGFQISEKVEMILSSDTPGSICKSMGLGMIGFSDALDRLKPDIVITLGDRFENMAVSTTCWTMRIPVAHIQGGEKTKGAIDDQFRHCITKLSFLHFTATEEYRNRVIQLGEHPDRVFNVGALNVEAMKRVPIISKDDLQKALNIDLSKKIVVITYHPVTLEKSESSRYFGDLLRALDRLKNCSLIFTKTLADTDGRAINQMIDDYASVNRETCIASTSLGQLKYVNLLRYADLVIGNSSSGIIETPTFKVPTVNIGKREEGRIMALNVICCDNDENQIYQAATRALSTKFVQSLVNMKNPYEKPNTSALISEIIRKTEIENTMKDFYDLR